MKTCRFILLLVWLVVGHSTGQSAIAQDITTRADIDKRITTLEDDDSIPPTEILNELNQLIPLIKENKWHKSLFEATALKIEVLLLLEQYNDADSLILEFIPKIEEYDDLSLQEVLLRYKISELEVADARGGSKKSAELRVYLLDKVSSQNDPMVASSIYSKLGYSEVIEKNYTRALKHYKKAYDLQLSVNENKVSSSIMNSLANVYVDLNDIEKAKEFFEKALVIDRQNRNQFAESVTLYNLGKSYYINKEYEQSKGIFKQALALSYLINDEVGVQWSKYSLADVHLKAKEWEQAANYYEDTVQVFSQSGDNRMYFDSALGLSEARIGQGLLDKAEKSLELAKSLLPLVNDKYYSAIYLSVAASLSAAKGDYITAYTTQKEYSTQKDVLYYERLKENSQKYRVQFDSEIKENENKILSKQNELGQFKIAQQQQQQKYWYLIIALAACVILIVILALYKQIQHRNRFKAMALRDHLTNSPNRRAILSYAQERFKESKSTQMDLCIGIVDLDFFKKVNDTYGHDVGDEVLKSFALSCKAVVRKQDRFGRYGGEEWLFVLSDTERSHIQSIFERLSKTLNEMIIPGFPPDKTITFSMGVAQFKSGSDKTLQSLINRADECLYKAKATGRNKFEMDNPG